MRIEIKLITGEETWLLRHKVMWPNMPFDFIKLPEDADGEHFGLFYKNELVSVVSLFSKDNTIFQFRKLATKVEEQGKGYASKLIRHIIAYTKNKNGSVLWCNARKNKSLFYKKFGLVETDKTYIKQHVAFVIMEKYLIEE